MTTHVIEKKVAGPKQIRKGMKTLEEIMRKIPGVKFGDDCAPLKHVFTDNQYLRQITMPKGMLFISKLHKTTHPYFVLKGDVSVLTEKGVVRIKSPYSGITKAGTKRVLFTHEETVWTTIHFNPSNTQDLKEIESHVIAKNYRELPDRVRKQLLITTEIIEEAKLITFVEKFTKKEEKCGN